jgi:hypothetical protein
MKKNYFIGCLIMILGISVKTMAQTDPGTVNLTHRWTFDNGNANDNVGTVNGTLMGTATVANGDLITSTLGWVELDANALAVKTYSELTVSAWFTSVAGANTAFHFLYYFGNTVNGNGDSFTGFTPARGNDVSMTLIGAGDNVAQIAGTEYDDGLLHHVVCVIDATTISYYIDGRLNNTTAIGANSLANIGNQFAYFAKGGWANDPTWNGSIHEISMYNKALTADNVKFLYNVNAPVAVTPVDPGTTNLTHKWTFDDGTANDVVGTVNGTLSNGATVSNKVLNLPAGAFVTLDPVALAVNTYSALTVEAWFTSLAGANKGYHFLYYFGNSDGNGNHFTGFTPDRDGNPSFCGRFMIATGNGEDGEMAVNSPMYDEGLLHHMVCVIDGTTLTAYIDGNLLGSNSIGSNSLSNIGLPGSGTDFAYFGKGGWADPTWQGTISKISMYNSALTAANVKFLYNAGAETGLKTGVYQTTKLVQNVYVNNNQIVAEFESPASTPAQIDVYSIQGNLLSSIKFSCNAGSNHKSVTVNYPAGIYLVRLAFAGQSAYTKIVK